MKNTLIILLFVFLISTVSACSNVTSQEHKENISNVTTKRETESKKGDVNDKEIIMTVDVSADLIVSYDTTEELVDGSEIIVQGKILEANSYVQEPGIITEYTLEVTNSIYGEVEENSVITFVGAGGVVPYKEFEKLKPAKKDFEPEVPQEKTENGYVEYIFEGAPLINIGEEYIIFANKVPVGDKQMYGILGVSQGQYKVIDDEVFKYEKGKNKKFKIKEFLDEVNKNVKLKKDKK